MGGVLVMASRRADETTRLEFLHTMSPKSSSVHSASSLNRPLVAPFGPSHVIFRD